MRSYSSGVTFVPIDLAADPPAADSIVLAQVLALRTILLKRVVRIDGDSLFIELARPIERAALVFLGLEPRA